METLVIEAVSDKFKNKYSSGSVKAGGKWFQVSSKIDINSFKKDSEVVVETKTNDKGYTSITKLAAETASEPVAKSKTDKKETSVKVVSYDDAKNRKILVQGVTQASLSSPALALLPITTVESLAENAQALALKMIEFVDSESSR